MSTLKLTCLLITLLGAIGPAQAQSMNFDRPPQTFDDDFDNKAKPWQELTAQLPPLPQAENLLPFYVSAAATQSFNIDARSISVGDDGVVRYTLVARSAGGAENISYEGIRCQSFEKKLYAFGHKDGTWSRSRRNEWTPITDTALNRQHAALALDYFCSDTTVAAKTAVIVEKIRSQRPLSARIITGGGL